MINFEITIHYTNHTKETVYLPDVEETDDFDFAEALNTKIYGSTQSVRIGNKIIILRNVNSITFEERHNP